MNHNSLHPDEKVDDLMRNNLQIIQSSKLPKFNMDGVFLANFPEVKDNWEICDLCTGTGIIPLLLTTRANNLKITGLEVNAAMVEMAKRSIELNKLAERIEIFQEDIRCTSLKQAKYDLVTVNPPYFEPHSGLVSVETARAQARTLVDLSLEQVIDTAYDMLRQKGLLAMVFHSRGLDQLLPLIASKQMGVTRVRFIHHRVTTKSSSFLLEAQKGVNCRMIVEPPLIIYDENGSLTSEVQGVYFAGKPLESRAY